MNRADRVEVIDGVRVGVFDRPRPVPPTLELMLNGGRDSRGLVWAPLRVVHRLPLHVGGARPECGQQIHRLGAWLEGFHTGSDGITRYLHLQCCSDCGAVCIRDYSFEAPIGLLTGRLPLRRKDYVIGWYTGARPNQRVYT